MRFFRIGSTIAVMLCAACVSHVRQPYAVDSDSAVPVHAAPPGPYMQDRQPVEMRLNPAGTRKNYRVETFSFAASGDNGQAGNRVSGRLYRGSKSAVRPVIIVLPVWGISEYPSKKFTGDLLRHSKGAIDIMLVAGENYLIDWEALRDAKTEASFRGLAHEAGARIQDMVIDVRRMVDWLVEQPQTDRDNIAVIGFSLSAVVASLVLQHERRLSAGVVVMGGSDPAEIFTVCGGKPGMVREAMMQRFGYSLEAYQRLFEQALAGGDSRDYGGRIADPSRVLFIESAYDDCMTQASRDGLWEALGRPERISFRFPHRKAFYSMSPLGFNVLGRYAIGFFERTLLQPRDTASR